MSYTGSEASVRLRDSTVANARFMKDMAKMSPTHQTFHLEAFNSMMLMFAPKSVAYSYHGMVARYANSSFSYNKLQITLITMILYFYIN